MSNLVDIQYNPYNEGWVGWSYENTLQYCGADYGVMVAFKISSIPAGYKISQIKVTGSQTGAHNLRADLRTKGTDSTDNKFYNVGSGGTIATATMSASTNISITLKDFEISTTGWYYIFLKSTEGHYETMYPMVTITATDSASGAVRIFTTSTQSGMYIPYVYDSGKWYQRIPYVYDGGWKIGT